MIIIRTRYTCDAQDCPQDPHVVQVCYNFGDEVEKPNTPPGWLYVPGAGLFCARHVGVLQRAIRSMTEVK